MKLKPVQPIYLVCGVSGAGKTWVCEQLQDKFHYIPHDKHYDGIFRMLVKAAHDADKPIITEVPFAERELRDRLRGIGLDVHPIFVIEDPAIVGKRYYSREGKRLPKAAATRASTITNRAVEWGAPKGTSTYILNFLKALHA